MACISKIRYIIKNIEYKYSYQLIYKTAVAINKIYIYINYWRYSTDMSIYNDILLHII